MEKNTPFLSVWGIFVAVFLSNIYTLRAYGLEESTGPGGSNAVAVHQLGQTGQDVNIGLIAAYSVLTTHEAFYDKDSNGNPIGSTHAFNYDFSGDGNSPTSHDTRMAGIAISRGGLTYPDDIGVAPGANLCCARIADNSSGISWLEFSNALKTLITTLNCRIIVTGIAFSTTIVPNGDSDWTMLYDYYAYQNNVIFANPAANATSTILVFGDAYNGLTTGGLHPVNPTAPFDYRMVGSLSSSGPTVDGRRKPDIGTPADSQIVPSSESTTTWVSTPTSGGYTSFAVPHTAGAAALLLGLADQTPEPNDNRNEVIKAVLVNSAMPNVNDKNNASTNPADSNNTWQADRGYGRLDCLRAYQMLDTNEVEPNTLITQSRGWGYGQLTQGQSGVYTISVTDRCRLIATLTWHRRMTWTDWTPNGRIDQGELSANFANLDMKVFAPAEPNAIFSKALFGFNNNDNLVKCDLLILSPGNYTISIENNSTNGEPANYGFAFDLHPLLPGDLPPVDYVVDYNDLSTFTDDWLIDDSPLDSLLSHDGIIDFADFAILADYWLQYDPLYYNY
jgi:hypothetical protein